MEKGQGGGTSTVVKERAREKLLRDLGDTFMSAFNDPTTVEIMLNADHRLWQERLGEGMRCIGTMRPSQSEAVIKTTAGYYGKEITRANPVLESEFPLDGSRFAAQLPPIVSGPTFALRKKAVSIFSLADYVASGTMSAQQRHVLIEAIHRHRNILVIGGTGSGKTTLINAIIREMVDANADERVFIIEDTGEIQCSAENFVQYRTSFDVSMTQLLRTSLRMRPDRILVGEVRGPEALDLLMAWNTGHEGGAATLHANDARAGLSRLSMLISMHRDAPRPIEPLIGESVHMLVHISRTPSGRRVQEIVAVDGYEDGRYVLRDL
ncbi:type IV secretion system protein VirB11 [Luteibacter sp. OK325]|uniref:P-type conjugative transfer ATPase TrbB n=1 Tax=Luteibacter sp. OK325 TaxID=2135670 RepID=UPI000D331F98|nr:P-type conjugative transfer ATPase TrbB [Luteibacter sp. OK325]PTR35442.1 type IV secretion system protein VirB11 [Luteibacter sp. OK325]